MKSRTALCFAALLATACSSTGVVALIDGADAGATGDDAGAADASSANDAAPDATAAPDTGTPPDASDGAVAQPDAADASDGAADTGVDAGPPGDFPTTAPPAPTVPPAKVISLFSAAYTGGIAGGDYSGRVDSYNATCFGPLGNTIADYGIAGANHTVKQYVLAPSTFGIVETIGATGGTQNPPDSAICKGGTQSGALVVDVTAMTGLHVDVWSPLGSKNFQVLIVGADATATIAGPGGAAGSTPGFTYATGALKVDAKTWVSIDLPLSAFGPGGAPAFMSRLALVKLFTTEAGTFFVDNLYFYKN
jgi:hypothetical protein